MKSLPILAVVASVIVAVPRPVDAQTGLSETAIELRVAQSSLIARATVADVKIETIDAGPAKGLKRTVVTLKVGQILKGMPTEEAAFSETGSEPDRRYEAWKAAGTELLWFLAPNEFRSAPAIGVVGVDARSPLSKVLCVRLGPAVAADAGYAPAIKPMFLMDLTFVKGPDAIVEAVKAAVADPSDGERDRGRSGRGILFVQGHILLVPAAIMGRSGRVGEYNLIEVPTDRRLETLAKGLIRSPGAYLPPIADYLPDKTDADRVRNVIRRSDDEDDLRAEGAKALVYFKTAENVGLLKTLLVDSASTRVTRFHIGKPDEECREFHVRKAAYDVLRSWGIEVERPILREPVVGKE